MDDFSTPQILALASGIYDELNSPSSLSIGYISGVLTSSGFLGGINKRLTICLALTGEGPTIIGGMGGAVENIASLQFQLDYAKRQAMSALQGLGGSGFVTSLRDGDSSIARESPVKAAAEWRGLRKELEQTLAVAVANWKLANSTPRTVDTEPLSSFPTP